MTTITEVSRGRAITDGEFDLHNGYLPHDFAAEGTWDLLHDVVEAARDKEDRGSVLAAIDEMIRVALAITCEDVGISTEDVHRVMQQRRGNGQYWHSSLVNTAVDKKAN